VATPGTTVGRVSAGDGGATVVPRPALFEALSGAARITLVSAPAGSGKTFLLRSWIASTGIGERVAWVSVRRGENDAQGFWLAIADALRATHAGSELIGPLTATPDLASAAIVDRLLDDLTGLDEPLWLVLDDLHELEAHEGFEQLQRLLAGAPLPLRLLLVTRRDLRLGLHRLRLEGHVTELRRADLRFTREESRALFLAAGVHISEDSLDKLVARTEGWAAGLRLAALSLAGNTDPDRFAAEFSGSERTVAEYLLEEVLARQPPEVSRLLLRTSILERVSSSLADRLTGGSDAERILAELEAAGGFVVALDPQRSWYRYHHLFSDLLALELRRTAPDELPALHAVAAEWLAEHDSPIEAIRHAQAAQLWRFAADLLSDHWLSLALAGRPAAARELLAGFPPAIVAADAELAAVSAVTELTRGGLAEASRWAKVADDEAQAVPADRRARLDITLAMTRLILARQRNDLPSVVEQAQRLLEPATSDAPGRCAGEELRALALNELGAAEIWTGHFDDAERHLEEALELATRDRRPLIELLVLSHIAVLQGFRGSPLSDQRAREAIELARANGWAEEPLAAVAYVMLGATTLWRGELHEAERWFDRAGQTRRSEFEPAVGLVVHASRGLIDFVHGRHEESLAAFRAAERLEALLVTPHRLATTMRAHHLVALAGLGETERVRRALAALPPDMVKTPQMRVATAALRLAEDDLEGVTDALEPVIAADDVTDTRWWIQALLLEAIAHDGLRDAGGASRALERALDLAEPTGLKLPFLFFPAARLLERHRRAGTAHASLVADILTLLAGRAPTAASTAAQGLDDPLSDSELRVLRYLPTNLPAPEIASELFVSVNTIRTHMRHVYAKLGVHRRAEAVQRARDLGLLSPGSSTR
jgi:LuxR family maltose regulon positive regulatory protein